MRSCVFGEHAQANSKSGGTSQVHIGKWICGALAAAVVSAPSFAATAQAPIVITLDARDYITYTTATFTPSSNVMKVVNSAMDNCRRAGGESMQSGKWHLNRSSNSLDIDFDAMRLEFNPTRLVLDSSTHDIVCDGQAMGWQTGIGRLFEDDFGDG